MNTVITIHFLTPYISSITRDQDYVHSPLPLDGALAHAAYWQALVAGHIADSPTGPRADPTLMAEHITPVLDSIFEQVSLGELLGDHVIQEKVYSISSGFPIVGNQLYHKYGARWLSLDSRQPLIVDYETQPLRKRVPVDRISSLDLSWVGERGGSVGEPETGKGTLKAIDNRILAWQIYEYAWLAQVRDTAARDRLQALLRILYFQGMGKKRTAGFGKIFGEPLITDLNTAFPELAGQIRENIFLERDDQLVLLRPLPYDAIMLAPGRVVMTNLIVESGCGYRPPYWNDRRVVVREGTIFRFLN
jgi:hypothetical protein